MLAYTTVSSRDMTATKRHLSVYIIIARLKSHCVFITEARDI